MSTRREFIGGALAAGAWFSGTLPSWAVEPNGDWKAAFRKLGFDPEAKGCGTFAVIGDPHVTNSDNEPLKRMIDFWNTMSPRPAFALSVGDQLCNISRCFGDRKWPSNPAWKESCDKEFELLKSLIAPCEIPFKHVIGNHDTYPNEVGGKLYASHFPGWKPYERFDALGVQFMLLNGGHDAWIDPEQQAWIDAEAKKLDDNRALVVVAHQPSMCRHRENGIPRAIRQAFEARKGEFWFLGGHEHHNNLERFHMPNGTMLGVATHTRAPFGFWLYGVRNGSIVCRLFVRTDGIDEKAFGPTKGSYAGWKAPETGRMPSELKDRGLLPIPFETTTGVLWKLLVGEDGDKEKYRVECFDQSDAGHWYFYIGRTTYRLPLKDFQMAKRVAFLGCLRHHRKTGEHEKVFLSFDNENWVESPDVEPKDDVYIYDLSILHAPAAGDGCSTECGVTSIAVDGAGSTRTAGVSPAAEWIYLRVDGFRHDCDSSIAGYALLA